MLCSALGSRYAALYPSDSAAGAGARRFGSELSETL